MLSFFVLPNFGGDESYGWRFNGMNVDALPSFGVLKAADVPFKRITFYEDSPHGERLLDPSYGDGNPVGGSETATLGFSATLRSLGFDVRIILKEEDLRGHQCDIFISNRRWSPFEHGLAPGRLNYLWCHDDAPALVGSSMADPVRAKHILAALDGVFFLSHFQQQRWLEVVRIPLDKLFLTTNGVSLDRFRSDSGISARAHRVYYSSTPFRGLRQLLDSWSYVRKYVPDAELNIFSSMRVYKSDDTADFKVMYDRAKGTPGVVYHGSVGQSQLREVAQMSRALAYPCVFPETSCITAMEAMASGCVVVSTALGALPETAWRNPLVPISDGWLDQWKYQLVRVLLDDRYYASIARHNLSIVGYYDYNVVGQRWIERMRLDYAKKNRK